MMKNLFTHPVMVQTAKLVFGECAEEEEYLAATRPE
jgi:hypothetical protein